MCRAATYIVHTCGCETSLAQGAERRVALEAKLTGETGPGKLAHIRAVVIIVISLWESKETSLQDYKCYHLYTSATTITKWLLHGTTKCLVVVPS